MDHLVKLDMVNFNVIISMGGLYICYASVDCRTRVVKFQFPHEPFIEWRNSLVVPKNYFIS